ncbi:MAG: hypothetical protein GIW95_08690 [Candidatus Eremiobacteraeota bacterium]|nr:hypothetical protein [Candidatus Eremiobacteraeota bacterium]
MIVEVFCGIGFAFAAGVETVPAGKAATRARSASGASAPILPTTLAAAPPRT